MVFAFAKAQSQRNSSDIIFSQSNVQVVDVELNSTIELTIKTTTEKDIRITSSQGGEYKNAIVLNSKIENDTLKITDPFQASFRFPQDKLSAHKIIDGAATIYLPENLRIQITSRNCFLKVTGVFKDLFINIESGHCEITKVNSPFHIITVYANVRVFKSSTIIETSSKYGNVVVRKHIIENWKMDKKIETINGNITIED